MNLREMIERHEGRKRKKYRCSRNHWSIGVGWNIDASPLPPDIAACLRVTGEITEEMIDRLLDISIDVATRQCREIYTRFDGFAEARRFGLIDFVFNLGAQGALGFKKMLKAIIAGDWNEAANQVNDSAYWRQLGGDPAGTDDGKLERPEEIAQMLRDG